MPTGHASLMPTLRRVVLAGTAADRTDGQLLGAFVTDRDADAFGVLVRRHGPMVLGVCRRLLADHATADDAFQAVFLVLARRAAAVRPRDRVGNWLYGVAYRTALKARAALARRRSREKQVPVMPEPPVPAPRDDWADVRPVLDAELAALPEKLRTPVVLCDLEGRTQREVARALGLPAATVATRLATARRTLAQRLTRRGVALSGGALGGLLTAHGASASVPVALARGVTAAAGAIATGTSYSALVSAGAVHLSEGVLRMMMLTKLKALAVAALTTAAITGGLGLGLVPAQAQGPGDAPSPGAKIVVARVAVATDAPTEPAAADDAAFLRRVCLDVRGTPPTDIETYFFVTDPDAEKRTKIVGWLLAAAADRAVAGRTVVVAAGCDAGDTVFVTGKAVRAAVEASEGTVGVFAAAADEPGSVPKAPVVKRFVTGTVALPAARADVVWGVQTDDEAAIHQQIEQLLRKLAAAKAQPDADAGYRQKLEDTLRKLMDFKAQRDAAALKTFEETLRGLGAAHPQGDALKKHEEALRWLQTAKGDGPPAKHAEPGVPFQVYLAHVEADIDFLKRVTTAARGTAPTALEEKYFTEDKDPKKREKLLDTLLKEPAVAKKLGDDFRKKMLTPTNVLKTNTTGTLRLEVQPPVGEPKPGELKFFTPAKPAPGTEAKPAQPHLMLEFEGKPLVVPFPSGVQPPVPPKPPVPPGMPAAPKPPAPPAAAGDRFGKLIDQLLAAKKTDAEMLEAVTLVAAGRLPTDPEKRLTLALVAKAADRKAAWVEVATALSGTEPAARVYLNVVPAAPAAPKVP